MDWYTGSVISGRLRSKTIKEKSDTGVEEVGSEMRKMDNVEKTVTYIACLDMHRKIVLYSFETIDQFLMQGSITDDEKQRRGVLVDNVRKTTAKRAEELGLVVSGDHFELVTLVAVLKLYTRGIESDDNRWNVVIDKILGELPWKRQSTKKKQVAYKSFKAYTFQRQTHCCKICRINPSCSPAPVYIVGARGDSRQINAPNSTISRHRSDVYGSTSGRLIYDIPRIGPQRNSERRTLQRTLLSTNRAGMNSDKAKGEFDMDYTVRAYRWRADHKALTTDKTDLYEGTLPAQSSSDSIVTLPVPKLTIKPINSPKPWRVVKLSMAQLMNM